jgi:hypothetical protein
LITTTSPPARARSDSDDGYTAARFEADMAPLRAHGARHEAFAVPGGHAWSEADIARAGACLQGVRQEVGLEPAASAPPGA